MYYPLHTYSLTALIGTFTGLKTLLNNTIFGIEIITIFQYLYIVQPFDTSSNLVHGNYINNVFDK